MTLIKKLLNNKYNFNFTYRFPTKEGSKRNYVCYVDFNVKNKANKFLQIAIFSDFLNFKDLNDLKFFIDELTKLKNTLEE